MFEGEKEVVPGLHVIPAPGHTPGHVALVISSSKEQLPHLEWRKAFDMNQDDAATTQRRLFDRAAPDNAIVLAYHFPFPGIGSVKKSANA